MWRGRGEEENGGEGINALCGWRSWIRRQWLESRKLDDMDDMNEVIAKWKGDKQARKTDVECRKTT